MTSTKRLVDTPRRATYHNIELQLLWDLTITFLYLRSVNSKDSNPIHQSISVEGARGKKQETKLHW